MRNDIAQRIQGWIAGKQHLRPDRPLIQISDKRTAEMLREDLETARAKWIKEAKGDANRQERETSSFLNETNDAGQVVDFHALRMTFITNLTRSGVSPKTAQPLARHCDINLTMNTYTMLGVMDQAAAIEALPPIPTTVAVTNAEGKNKPIQDGRLGAA